MRRRGKDKTAELTPVLDLLTSTSMLDPVIPQTRNLTEDEAREAEAAFREVIDTLGRRMVMMDVGKANITRKPVRRRRKSPPIYIRRKAREHLARCLAAAPGIELGDFMDDLILRWGAKAVLDFRNGTAHGVPVWPEELG